MKHNVHMLKITFLQNKINFLKEGLESEKITSAKRKEIIKQLNLMEAVKKQLLEEAQKNGFNIICN